jgi:hypothetical protein
MGQPPATKAHFDSHDRTKEECRIDILLQGKATFLQSRQLVPQVLWGIEGRYGF